MSLLRNGHWPGGYARYALGAGAALLLACGARPGLEPLHEAGVFPDAGLPDAFVPSCELSWAACRVSAGPVKVGDALDMPAVAWTGSTLLVAVDDDARTDDWAVTLVGYSSGAEEQFRLPVGKMQDPALAWNAQRGVGLVVTDRGLRWLDASGRPSGSFRQGGEDIYRWYRAVAAAPVPGGFLAAAGAWGYSEDPGLLQDTWVGATSEPFRWHTLESGGLWPRPALHVSPRDGYARWLAAARHEGPRGLLFRVTGQSLELEAELDGILPEGDWGAIEAVTEVDGDVVLLYGSWLPESDRNSLWLVRLGPGAPSPAAELFRIDEAGNGADGTFLELGGDVLLASATIHPSYVVTVAPLRLDSPDGPLGEDRLVAAQGFSRSPSMARTPRGFAISWFEEATVQLAVYDCCVE